MFIKKLFSTEPTEVVKGDQHTPVVRKAIQPILPTVSSPQSKGAPLKRKKEVEKEELIREYSELSKDKGKVLENTLKTWFFSEKDTHKLAALLGHIHGDRVLSGSNLENISPHVGAQLFNAYLTEQGGAPDLQSAFTQLSQTAKEFRDLPQRMEEAQQKWWADRKALEQKQQEFWQKKYRLENQIKDIDNTFRKDKAERINELRQEIQALEKEKEETDKKLQALESDPKPTVFCNYAKQLMQSIYDLKSGASFFIVAEGIENGLTHSVFFEFKKMSNGCYDLFVYVIGKSDSVYEKVLYRDRRHWVRPFMHYSNIPSAHLFFTDKKQTTPQYDFFQALLETRTLKNKFEISPRYTALKVLGHLQRYRVFADQDMSGFISSARSHVDGWHGVKAIALRYLKKENFKKTTLEMKFRSLVEGYHLGKKGQLEEDSVEGNELRTVLKAGAESLLRQLVVFQKEKWISGKLSLSYEATALELLDQIEKIEKTIESERRKKVRTMDYVAIDYVTKRKESLEKAKQCIIQSQEQAISLETPSPRLPKLWAAKDFALKLTEFIKVMPLASATQVHEVEHLVAQFAIPEAPNSASSYWSKIPEDQLSSAIDGLEALLEKYDLSTRGSVGAIAITPREANTVFALYVILHFLALRADQVKNKSAEGDLSRLSSYPLYFPGDLYDKDPYLAYTSPEDFEKRSAIRRYCNATGTKKEYPQLFWYRDYWWFSDDTPKKSTNFYTFLLALSEKHGIRGKFESNAATLCKVFPHLSPDTTDNLFKKKGLNYIPALAYASFMAHQFSGFTHLRNDPVGTFKVKVEAKVRDYYEPTFSAGNKDYKDYPGSNESNTVVSPSSDPIHPRIQGSYSEIFTVRYGTRYAERERTYPGSHEELDILKAQAKHAAHLRAAIVPTLQPYKMIYDAKKRLDLFTTAEEQTLFELEFFRSVIVEKKERFPLMEEMKQQGLVRECKRLIDEGVERYFYLQVGRRPHVFATLFFLRLACRLSRFTDAPLLDPIPYLKKMLQLSDLTEEEKSALSLHLIVAYSTQNKKLNDEEKEELFQAWVYYKNTPLPPQWKNVLLEKEAASFLNTQTPTSLRNEREFLEKALKVIGVNHLPAKYKLEKRSFPLICAAVNAKEFWKVNLLTGQMCNEEGIMQRGSCPSWEPRERISRDSKETEHYKYLFGAKEHTYFQTGSTLNFHDKDLGQMRVLNGDIINGLQRYIGDGWYAYVPPKVLDEKEIPKSLLADHTHWVPINKDENHLLICDFKTGELKAKLNEQAEIHPFDKATNKFDETRTLRIADEMNVFPKMEQEGYILFSHHGGKLEKAHYSRFLSQSGEPLEFEMKDGQAIYSLNRKYLLSSEQTQGLLGGITQYLMLTHEKGGRKKVLIPARPLSVYNPLTSLHKIDTHDLCQKWKNEYALEQKGRYTFLEYDLKGSELIPLTTEGSLYLAYLCLAQREYLKAKAYIERLDFRQRLSPLSIEILKNLLEICEEGYDCSPASAAVVLWAYQLSKRAHERMRVYNPCREPKSALQIYRRNQESIPAGLELMDLGEGVREHKSRDPSFKCVIEGPVHSIKLPKFRNDVQKYGFSKDSYNNYEGYQNYYMAQAATHFLEQSKIPSSYNSATIQLSNYFGEGYTAHCFREIYEIARKGSDAEREKLRFRLQMIEELRTDKEQFTEHLKERSNAWSILHFAYLHPQLAPELPPADDVEKRYQFLKEMHELVQKTPSSSRGDQPQALDSTEPQPTAPLLKSVLPTPKQVQKVEDPLLLSPLSKEAIDEGFISQLFKDHLFVMKEQPQKLENVTFFYDPKQAKSDEEKAALNAINAEFSDFGKDYAEGLKINQKREVYDCRYIENLKKSLEQKSQNLAADLQNLEVTLIEIANRLNPASEPKQTLLRESKVEAELTIKNLIGLFLTQDPKAFEKSNPYLTNREYTKEIASKLGLEDNPHTVIDYLYNLTGLYLTTAVYRQKLERAKEHCRKITQEIDPPSLLEQEDLIQKLAEELNPERLSPYKISEDPLFLAFEYLSCLAIRPEQANLLARMTEMDKSTDKFRNLVAQLIMGGGKTSVLAVILLKLAAKSGRLSLFVTPASQYASVGHNLRKIMKEYFDQEMEDIDIPGDEIVKRSDEIYARLQKAMERGDFVLVKPETLLCIQLKFLTLVFEQPDRLYEINSLRRTLVLLRHSAEALIDEVDLVLNILQEMNVPLGEKQYVSSERIDIIRELFFLFTSENAPLDDKGRTSNLKKLISLSENRQTLLSDANLKGEVSEAVAYHFASSIKKLNLSHNSDFIHSFYRYISGKINTDCQKMIDMPNSDEYQKWADSLNDQDKKDLEFLLHVREMRKSNDAEKEEAAHLIAIIKHVMLTILPSTFQKMGNRHYGRGSKVPGEVRPYLAVDTPSQNHFGYIFEWIVYHFQTALQCKITAPHLSAIAAFYREGAENSLKAKRLVYDDKTKQEIPPEALEFREMTGVDLEEMDKPHRVQEAVKNLENNLKGLLQLEADTAGSQVVFHPHRLTANGISLVNMLNARVMSATPYNAHCYEDCLADNNTPDWGTEGQIAVEVLKRIQTQKEKRVHLIESRKLEDILKDILGNHPKKDQVRMLMDSGALLKDYTNLEVAQALKKLLNKPILFFTRDPNKAKDIKEGDKKEGDKKEEDTPDTLALLPLDSDQVRIIGGTRLEDIEKTGHGIGDYFVYDDDRHTTGTDIPVPFDAIGIMTVDETMMRRTFFQTILRLRQFFSHQNVEFVIPKEILGTLPTFSSSNEQLEQVMRVLLGAIRNQGMRKGKDYYRSRKQKIDSLFEQTLLTSHLLLDRDLKPEDLSKVGPFKNVLKLPQKNLPYDMFGALEYPVDSIKDLISYGAQRLAIFKDAGGDAGTIKRIEEEINKVIEKAKNSPWRLLTVLSPGVNDLGMEADILQEVNKDINKDIDQEKELELLTELEMYESDPDRLYLREDHSWKEAEIEHLFRECLDEQPPSETLSIPNLFNLCKYKEDYSALFDERISATKEWAYSTKNPLPVFHRLQRPAEQMLIFKTAKGYRALLISQNEAKWFKAFLNEKYPSGKYKDMWLVQSDLSSMEDNPSGLPPAADVADLLLQVNALNGNLTYLEARAEETKKWLRSGSLEKRKLHYLRLKTERDPVRKKQYFTSPLFGADQTEQKKSYASLRRDKIVEMKREEIQALGEKDKNILQMLSETQLSLITPDQVPYLRPSQMSMLRGQEYVAKIPKDYKAWIVKEQLPDLAPEQKLWFEPPAPKKPKPEPAKNLEAPQPAIPKQPFEEKSPKDLPQPIVVPTPKVEIPKNIPEPDLKEDSTKKLVEPKAEEPPQPVENEKSQDSNSATSVIETPAENPSSEHVKVSTSEEQKKITEVKKGHACFPKSLAITLIVLAILFFVGVAIVGVLAIIGGQASGAPTALLNLSKGLGPAWVPYIMIACGPAFLIILGVGILIRRKCGATNKAPIQIRV